MTDTRKSFTFIWKIKNFSFSFNNSKSALRSPLFYVHAIFGTKWNLLLFSNSLAYKNCVVCYLERKCYDLGPTCLVIDSELSFIAGDESVIHSRLCRKISFHKGNFDLHVALCANKEDVYISKKHLFISDDTLTIRCRMWKSKGSIPISKICSVRTRINTKCITFVGTVKNFNSVNTNCKKKVSIKSQPKDFLISSIYLCVNTDGKLEIEITPAIYEPMNVYKFKVFILNVFKNKLISCQGEIYDGKPFCAPLSFLRSSLIKNKEVYLPNDVLTLKCQVTFSAGNTLTQIGLMTSKYDYQDFQTATSNATNPITFSVGNKLTQVRDMKDKNDHQDIQIETFNATNPITFSAGNQIRNMKDKNDYQDFQTATSNATNSISFSDGNKLSQIGDMANKNDYQDIQTATSNSTNPITFSAGNKLTQIGDMTNKNEYQGIQMATSNATNPSPLSEERYIEGLTTLKDGLILLFIEGILCDAKLKTATEIFPVHKVVLSAQSPVFKSMFTTDMKEKTNDFVEIEDLDADTVREMLFFMYSDILDNLEYERAKNLYFAADKYNIISLKQKCSDFLKQNLQHLNCCDVLLLADKHQDNDLKR
ncbi:uncharacterized protein LOC129987826 isoform X2 [Argiope bruennichi]|nr:uncharacterized protein LOC129987826 isoform X2 [Argiope bruennichi]